MPPIPTPTPRPPRSSSASPARRPSPARWSPPACPRPQFRSMPRRWVAAVPPAWYNRRLSPSPRPEHSVHRMPPEEFHRIRRLPPYVFAEVNTAKARARTAGEDIIDLGMGNPDSPTPPHIVAKLIEAVQDPRTHRYSVSKGIPGLRRALAGYYDRRFGVKLDPETEVVVTLGSKEGLANLAAAITSPGDTILVPNPSYPIHQFGFIIAGASVRSVPAKPGPEMLESLD